MGQGSDCRDHSTLLPNWLGSSRQVYLLVYPRDCEVGSRSSLERTVDAAAATKRADRCYLHRDSAPGGVGRGGAGQAGVAASCLAKRRLPVASRPPLAASSSSGRTDWQPIVVELARVSAYQSRACEGISLSESSLLPSIQWGRALVFGLRSAVRQSRPTRTFTIRKEGYHRVPTKRGNCAWKHVVVTWFWSNRLDFRCVGRTATA